jgi:2-oxoglutarate dehydrogenase E2 component (dihydrolipoamide succinyltransferase)
MPTDVIVPTLGESITEATLGQWIKKPGEPVRADEPIASLETDKVSVEVPSPVAGTMGDYLVKEGDTVAVGALIARIVEGGEAAAPRNGGGPQAEAQTDQSPLAHIVNPGGPGENPTLHDDAVAPMPGQGHDSSSDMGLTLSPAVRRVVLEHGLDPSRIKGTGKDGRLTKDDVLAAAARAPDPVPAPTSVPAKPVAATQGSVADSAQAGERREERVRMTRLRQTIARRLKEAQNTAALLTTFNDVDMTEVISARSRYKDLFEKKHGIRLGFMGFFVKAAALAARDVPSVNAYIEGDEIVYHDYLDVSVAVSAPNGLVVPVIRNADRLSFVEIEKTIADFGRRAKDGSLKMEEMHLALSYDHRLVDGREAVTFLVRMKEAIEDPTRLLIDL